MNRPPSLAWSCDEAGGRRASPIWGRRHHMPGRFAWISAHGPSLAAVRAAFLLLAAYDLYRALASRRCGADISI